MCLLNFDFDMPSIAKDSNCKIKHEELVCEMWMKIWMNCGFKLEAEFVDCHLREMTSSSVEESLGRDTSVLL